MSVGALLSCAAMCLSWCHLAARPSHLNVLLYIFSFHYRICRDASDTRNWYRTGEPESIRCRREVSIRVSKSQKTYWMEEIITLATWKVGQIGCAEVGLGDEGIVDYITQELGGDRTIRCYELKITKSDFLSDAKKTFIGDYNFYVIPSELWMDVRGYIEDGVGCWIVEPDGNVVKKKTARKMECKLNRSYVLARIVQALEREHMKYIERDWKRRRLAKGVTDYGRNRLWRGDIVEYSQRRWIVSDVIFKKDGTASNPQVIITDERSGNCTVAPASAVRKVVERKGI